MVTHDEEACTENNFKGYQTDNEQLKDTQEKLTQFRYKCAVVLIDARDAFENSVRFEQQRRQPHHRHHSRDTISILINKRVTKSTTKQKRKKRNGEKSESCFCFAEI